MSLLITNGRIVTASDDAVSEEHPRRSSEAVTMRPSAMST